MRESSSMDISSNTAPLRTRYYDSTTKEGGDQQQLTCFSESRGRTRSSLFSRKHRTTSMPHKKEHNKRRTNGEASSSTPKENTSLSFRRLSVRRRKQAEAFPLNSIDTSTRHHGLDESAPLSPKSLPSNSNNIMDISTSSRKRSRRRLSLNFLRSSTRDNSVNSSSGGLLSSLRFEKSRSKDSSKTSSKASSTVGSSDLDDRGVHSPSIADRTKIVAALGTSPSNTATTIRRTPDNKKSDEDEEGDECETESRVSAGFSCATAILGHTYMERICGGIPSDCLTSFDHIHSRDHDGLSEDPTIQESIECIFASQLEEGLGIWDGIDEEEEDEVEARPHHLPERNSDDSSAIYNMVSPSLLQQSRLNRCDRQECSLAQSKKRYEQASLVYVGTFDPSIVDNDVSMERPEGPLPCSCAGSRLPSLDPADWPQAPVLLRPTPGTGTRVKGVRMGSSKDYFWEPGSHQSWSECLAQKWGVPCKQAPRVGCCEHCAILPINNGNETEDEALVIDFESDLFDGSLLLRIRDTNGTTREPYDDSKGYFKGMNRRYQAVVRGRFKKSIPFTQLRTGFQFDRPCGKLPAKFILRGGIKVLSFFAPQLDAKLEGDRPHSLTPLGSTPQAICVDHDIAREPIQIPHQEPKEDERTLLGHASQASSSMHRARARKKAFDKLFVHNSEDPRTDPSKVYTFEFLQHLFNFQNFSIELGSMLGSVELEDVLDGQPLQIMAADGEHRLWSFDIWHENLWESAKRHDNAPHDEPAQ